jgi:hypothetical protein
LLVSHWHVDLEAGTYLTALTSQHKSLDMSGVIPTSSRQRISCVT